MHTCVCVYIYIYTLQVYTYTHTHTHTHTYIYIYIYIYIYLGKTGNESDSMKMYRKEKTQGLQRMILFIELFASVKCLIFLDLYQGL